MNERLNATKVLSRQKIYEHFINPGFYIAETISLLLALFLVAGFVKSIDSTGFNYQLHAIYELLGSSLEGVFGIAFLEKLFAEGPFVFTLYVSFLPIVFYLSVSSIFKLGLERKVGAVELVVYGPSDGTSYFLSYVIKDIFYTLIHLMALVLFLIVAAQLNNLVLGASFFRTIVVAFFLAVNLYALGIFTSTLSENSASAIVAFIGINLFFIMIMMGSFTIVSGYVRSLSSVISWIIQWVSPFYYWNLGLDAMETGSWVFYIISITLSLVLAMFVLFLSQVIIKIKGVRA